MRSRKLQDDRDLERMLKTVMTEHDQDVPQWTAVAFRGRTETGSWRARQFGMPLAAALVAALLVTVVLIFVPSDRQARIQASGAASTDVGNATSSTIGPSIGADGMVSFRGLTLQAPAEWVHDSYDRPCGQFRTDYVIVTNDENAPSLACTQVSPKTVYGIIVAAQEVAPTWLAVGNATTLTEVNGISVFINRPDANQDLIVVFPEYKVALGIKASTENEALRILDSVHPAT